MELKNLAIGMLIGAIIVILVLGMNLFSSMDMLHQFMDKLNVKREKFTDAEYGVIPKVPLFNKARDVDR